MVVFDTVNIIILTIHKSESVEPSKKHDHFNESTIFLLVGSAAKDFAIIMLAQLPCVSNGFLYGVKSTLPDKNIYISKSLA